MSGMVAASYPVKCGLVRLGLTRTTALSRAIVRRPVFVGGVDGEAVDGPDPVDTSATAPLVTGAVASALSLNVALNALR